MAGLEWYMHKPEFAQENERHKYLWDFEKKWFPNSRLEDLELPKRKERAI